METNESAETILPSEVRRFIRDADLFLEKPPLIFKLTQLVGRPLEGALKTLPDSVQTHISSVTRKALHSALRAAFKTLGRTRQSNLKSRTAPFSENLLKSTDSGRFHNAAAAITGTLGGFFGLATLPFELPVSTVLILRSIAQIAADFGEDLEDPETQLDCLFVFAVGSPVPPSEKAKTTGYYSARYAFGKMAQEAAAYLTSRGISEVGEALTKSSSPLLVKLLGQVASRFQLVVTEKFVAQAVPIIGAAAGGAINLAFSQHFNQAARFHFGLKSLERRFGKEAVAAAYPRFTHDPS